MKHLEACINFLIGEVEGKKIKFETLHPWRTDAMHILQHGLRVKTYTEQIIDREGIILDAEDEIALSVATLLHDVGNIHGKDGHAAKGVEMVQSFLKSINEKDEIINRVNELIYNHSDKKTRNHDIAMNLLKDGDALDEIGIQSVMMGSNWIDRQSAYYFVDLQKQLEEKEFKFIGKVFEILHFDASKEILNEKSRFIESVVKQLKIENGESLTREAIKLHK